MSHAEILAKLDAVIALSGSVDPFGAVDLALITLRSEINADTLAQEAALESAYLEREDYRHACTYASY
jgi:hypothetical protein